MKIEMNNNGKAIFDYESRIYTANVFANTKSGSFDEEYYDLDITILVESTLHSTQNRSQDSGNACSGAHCAVKANQQI